ncbi:MAG: CPBP family intramembrane metalloprotease [Ilumatobacter sp.]|uniref:CPBP family intramembrane glutamic endopeptidase n=1 Tax=Ilumatobacter sp. TaxID=1967498 RepID=UPI0026019A00|nr:CPBP family intramembrane glutamic endopeptidase [Ilumatobacter sp.]MDJ0770509.1 CPBP family intramembrane metalloprotease [Ilumatobacter sp.]
MSIELDPGGAAVIPTRAAVATWTVAWIAGTVLLASVVLAAMGADFGGDLTIPEIAAASAVAWAAFGVGLVVVSRRAGSGRPMADFAIGFRPADLVGVPLGVVTQLIFVPLLYVPLQAIWPDTFSDERLEERAQDLADRADGGMVILLALIVVVGAPIVEELVYRGLLQRSAAASIGPWPSLLVTSAFFSLIHFAPVEYPGLFLAGLAFGVCLTLTGRIGPAIVTHASFNATGLGLVLASTW